MTNLVASQTFTNDAVFNQTHYTSTLGNSAVAGGQAAMTVSYDKTSNSYTVTIGAISENFGPDQLSIGSPNFPVYYERHTSAVSSYLTLGSPIISPSQRYQYVNTGYWQRNVATSDGGFDLNFYPFTYGLQTDPTAVPRTGQAGFAIDMFGYFTANGSTGGNKAVYGTGTLNVDFGHGDLVLNGKADLYDIINNQPEGGPSQIFTGTAALASDGTFGGSFYSFNSGKLSGRFYGPAAQEVGGVIWSDDPLDTTDQFEGTFTGRQDGTVALTNFRLTEMVADEDFDLIGQYGVGGTLHYAANGSYTFIRDTTTGTNWPTFAASSKVGALSDAQFTTYQTSLDGNNYQLRLFNPGPANTTIALTYASFGVWSVLAGPKLLTANGNLDALQNNVYIIYGVKPQYGVLPAGQGTATYSGVVLGQAANANDIWSLSGSSSFALNLSTGALSASMSMTGKSTSGGG